MPSSYTGTKGELNFERDFVSALQKAGWGEVLPRKTVPDLIQNWRTILFQRNRQTLGDVPLSDAEMEEVMETVRTQANTPVKANHFISGRPLAVRRDSDSPDTKHAGKDVYLNLFSPPENGGGSSVYQIAEQPVFGTGKEYNDRRGDVLLLINGLPVIHIELKASGHSTDEAAEQIKKYAFERVFTGFLSLVQVFWAVTPDDAVFFANPGSYDRFNPAFFFRWGDKDNRVITNWRELIFGESHILSVPEAHNLVGYYCVADSARDTLKVCRSYQYTAIRAIVERTAAQSWGETRPLGGYVWCTTGGGKTMTSFKAGQMIIDKNLADKVVFVVDRRALDVQSSHEYNSFSRDGESVAETRSARELFRKLKSSRPDDAMTVTSIQKLSRIHEDAEHLQKDDLLKIREKRIVFIIDEAHRSQFGTMHERVKKTFCHALFFGFTGTPIFAENMRKGELTTNTVFGPVLAVYSLASGIRDGNVLGFYPTMVKTYRDEDLREAVALSECHVKSREDIERNTSNWALYRQLMSQKTPMASEHDEKGKIKKDTKGHPIKGIEDYLPAGQYDNDGHRGAVVKDIVKNFTTTAYGENGTLFHGILATTSIREAYAYWKLLKDQTITEQKQTRRPLHVTALFDTNTDADTESSIDKDAASADILTDYNRMFGTAFSRETDPGLSGFKEDLTDRLSHKGCYKNIGSDAAKCIDIVIVVEQLLTGFDSQFVNVLYYDKVSESDTLIQAISRTNRVHNQTEKPCGFVKFYRKAYTMRRNLDEALRLYCQGDMAGVEVGDLPENIRKLNDAYSRIEAVFRKDGISRFEQLPKTDEGRQMFRKEFFLMRSTFRTAMLQGFKWDSDDGKRLSFDQNTYRILTRRYEDLSMPRSGGTAGPAKPGYIVPAELSTMEMETIDADYLESRFRIVTMSDIEKTEDRRSRQMNAIEDIRNNLGLLSAREIPYARQVLRDLETGTLSAEPGKPFRAYIGEYRERTQKARIYAFAKRIGVDQKRFYDLYQKTGSNGIDQLALESIEKNADMDKTRAYFGGVSLLQAHVWLHKELKEYIANQKADQETDPEKKKE